MTPSRVVVRKSDVTVKVANEVRPGNVLTNRAVVTTSSFETNSNNNSTTFAVNVAAAAIVAKPAAKTAAPSPAISAHDLVIATSSGLVADVLRQKSLSGLLSFGR